MADENNVIIQMKDVCFSYPFLTKERDRGMVLDHLNFELRNKEKVGIIGHNGCGKTTLLHIIMGLLPTSSGMVRFFGNLAETEKDFHIARQKIGFLFQNADDQLFSPTVLEDVAFGPLNQGKTPGEARELSLKTLEKLNLKGFEDRITHKLSGGEKKLVALATVLVMQPCVLILDEPTTALDESAREHIISILNNLDISCIIVSHEYDFLVSTTRSIYSMRHGQIVYNGDSAVLHPHYHSHSKGEDPHLH